VARTIDARADRLRPAGPHPPRRRPTGQLLCPTDSLAAASLSLRRLGEAARGLRLALTGRLADPVGAGGSVDRRAV